MQESKKAPFWVSVVFAVIVVAMGLTIIGALRPVLWD